MDFKALIKETKEKREKLIINMLISHCEDCETLGGIKRAPAKVTEDWAKRIRIEIEQN